MEELLGFIASIRKDEKMAIQPDTLLFKDKVLDSLNILSLIGYVEERLGRRLLDDELIMKNFESAQTIHTTFFKGQDGADA